MQERNFPYNGFKGKNQAVSITLSDGRTFSICSKGQYKLLLTTARQRLVAQALHNGKVGPDGQIDEAEIAEKLGHWCENVCKFAPMDFVLERMTPQERETWKAQYRFGGINRKMS